ncbi:MAG: N-methyl-L-tryptophan oxidase [Thermomicrobiales bacterium]
MTHYSTIVLGGGTMGTSAAWELGKRGERALVLEQFGHVHTMGAHSGQTRVIRHGYAEGADYVPLVLHADDLWMDLEAESGSKVFHRVGALELAGSPDSHAHRARASAELHNVPFEWLDSAEIRSRWPQFRIPDDWEGGFGPRSGFLEIEPALRGMAASARANGVEIRENEPATGWGATAGGVWVETATGRHMGDRLIVTAGAWSEAILADLGLPLRVLRKTLWWTEVARSADFAPERMPVFVADRPGLEYYGFPIFGQPGLKSANHFGGETTTLDTVERTTRPGEEREIVGAARWLFGDEAITGKVVSSAVCLYTSTPDGHFIVDRHPEHANVVFDAGFSGHGFKFSPAIGEQLVRLLDPAVQPLGILSLARFGAVPA